jgi:hypothetical protein
MAAYLFVPWALVACGGSVAGSDSSDGGSSPDGQSSCVNIDLTTYDLSCQQASDCVTVSPGPYCAGYCACGGAAINADGQSRYDAATASVATGECFCPEEPTPQCLENICTVCHNAPSDPPQCASLTVDASVPKCVDVDLSTYDTSCQSQTDCVQVTAGQICTGSCECGGAAINASSYVQYMEATSAIEPAGCPCASDGEVDCIDNTCILCGPGADCGVAEAGPSH